MKPRGRFPLLMIGSRLTGQSEKSVRSVSECHVPKRVSRVLGARVFTMVNSSKLSPSTRTDCQRKLGLLSRQCAICHLSDLFKCFFACIEKQVTTNTTVTTFTTATANLNKLLKSLVIWNKTKMCLNTKKSAMKGKWQKREKTIPLGSVLDEQIKPF